MPNMNEAEELLAIHLTELGVVFERQYEYVPDRKFRADFAIFHKGIRLYRGRAYSAARFRCSRILVEVQGGVFSKQAHGSIQGVLRDNERLNEAAKAGYRMLRFTPDQIKTGEAKAFIAEIVG